MAELVANCPRCGAKRITFDLKAATHVGLDGWRNLYEAFCICRACDKSTIFLLEDRDSSSGRSLAHGGGIGVLKGVANQYLRVRRHVSPVDNQLERVPEHLPEDIKRILLEGAQCYAVGCYNAAGTMFRLCVDLATKPLLPVGPHEGLRWKTRRDLGLRLPWLIDNGFLPDALRELSHCIKEDGNDGAHQGTLSKEDAEDLLDFTRLLLERMFTEKRRLELAAERRLARRQPSQPPDEDPG